MDARDFFNDVVKPNYDEFVRSPNDIRLLWNVLVSMNTLPEFLALQQCEYRPNVSRNELYKLAEEIRGDLGGFVELKICADALKHIRKNFKDPGGGSTVSSTGLLPDDQATWTIADYDLVKVVHNAFATLQGIPELAPPEASNRFTPADIVSVLEKYGALLEKYPTAYMDETWLPLPKDQMRLVFKAAWKIAPTAELRSYIEGGWVLLSMFQKGVGPIPVDAGVPLDRSPESMKVLDRYLQFAEASKLESDRDFEEMREFTKAPSSA